VVMKGLALFPISRNNLFQAQALITDGCLVVSLREFPFVFFPFFVVFDLRTVFHQRAS